MQHGDTVRANVRLSGLPASHNTRQQLGNVVHDANVFLLQQCMNIHAIHVHYSLLLKYFYMDSQKRKHIHIINQELKFTYSILTAIFPGEPGLASCPLNSPQIHRKFIFGLQIRHITSNWIILFCGEGQRSRTRGARELKHKTFTALECTQIYQAIYLSVLTAIFQVDLG